MKTSRRRFLGVLGVLGVGAAGVSGLRWMLDPRESYILAVLRRELPYARFDDVTAREFARDLIANDDAMDAAKGRALAFVGAGLSPALARLMGGRFASKITGKEERIAGQFLLSTDFFELADRRALLTYIGLNDPYVMGCANPLATLV